jgi:hypothetical protein
MARSFSWLSFLALWLFAACMGLMEAAVVVYLRALGSGTGSELEQVHEMMRTLDTRLLLIERQREAATIVILLVAALLFSQRFAYRVLAFVLAFGIWDLTYYGFLRRMIGWPTTWTTLDVLFLIPNPWIAPVACPMLVAGSMVVFASLYLVLARTRALKSPHPTAWIGMTIGVALVLFSFMNSKDAYMRATGQIPRFGWSWFLGGYVLMVAAGVMMLIQLYREPKARFF